MADSTLTSKAKLALKISTTDFDSEIGDLVDACLKDLKIAGVETLTTTDVLIIRAVCTYCRMSWGSPADFDKLKASYDEQKAQLISSSDYSFGGGSV